MKRTILASTLITLAFAGASSAASAQAAYPSNALTDVRAADSVRMPAEEQRRADVLRDSRVAHLGGEGERPSRDSVQSMLARFYMDQFRNSQDPEAPYFTLMSKDANLAMGIGGVLNVTGWFDWNGMISGADFNPYRIVMPRTPEDMRNLSASLSGTSLFINIMGRHTPVGDFRAYVEGGFVGYGGMDFTLKKAYLQIQDFTIGYANTTFSDPAAQPNVLNPVGANGKVDKANVLVRYMHTWRNRWSVAGSVEFPSSHQQQAEGLTRKVRDYVPDVAALGQYAWDRGLSHVRLAAIVRDMAYTDVAAGQRRHVVGWGLHLSTVVHAGPVVTLYGLGSFGRGIASYTADLWHGDYDLLPDPDHAGRLYAPRTLGGTLGAKFQILPRLSTTVCAATLRNLAEGTPGQGTYKYGQFLSANVVYYLMPRLQLGLEYLAGKRMNYGGEKGNVNRLQASAIFSF